MRWSSSRITRMYWALLGTSRLRSFSTAPTYPWQLRIAPT